VDSASGDKALDALDRALAHRPERDDEAFSDATEHLCRLRDAMIAETRAGPVAHRERLGQLNAIISAVLSGHFPLGKTPWPEVQAATACLRSLLNP
jgi:hypothetical protein